MPGVAAEKATLRAEFIKRRAALDAEVRRTLSLAIIEHLVRLDHYRTASVVHTYIDALEGEVETRALVRRALAEGKRVLCPRTDRRTRQLVHYEVTSLDELELTRNGLWEPRGDPTRLVDSAAVDLVVAPGVVFDRTGGRIGYGAGFYDRFVASIAADQAIMTVGLGFSIQVREPLPREPHDMPLDAIVTEREVIDCRAERSAQG